MSSLFQSKFNRLLSYEIEEEKEEPKPLTEAELAALFEIENPKLENLPNERLYTVTDDGSVGGTKKSQFHEKLGRCIRRLPDTDVGRALYTTLQTIILKGNRYTDAEKNVYESFLKLL